MSHLDVSVNSAGYFRTTPQWRLDATRTRAWPDLDLWLLVAGRGFAQSKEGRFPISPGSCLLMLGGEDYQIVSASSDPLEHYYVHFDHVNPRSRRRIAHRSLTPLRFLRVAPSGSILFTLLDRVVTSTHQSQKHNANQWLAAALLEIAHIDQSAAESTSRDIFHQWIERTCDTIRRHPERDYSIDAWARETGYDVAYFSRAFRQRVGLSPKQFITQVRMETAQSLLRDSTLRIHAIASAVGYHDPQFFTRHFTHHHRLSPSHFRRT